MSVDYTKLHTKQLLALLHNVRAGYSEQCDNYSNFGGERPDDHAAKQMEALKAELAKRPHVPNKHEARAIRQAKAKK